MHMKSRSCDHNSIVASLSEMEMTKTILVTKRREKTSLFHFAEPADWMEGVTLLLKGLDEQTILKTRLAASSPSAKCWVPRLMTQPR